MIPFTLLWEFISAKFPAQTTILLGACFLLIVYFIPRGVVGLIEDLVRRLRQGRNPLQRGDVPMPSRPGTATLSVEGVSKRFGGLVAVDAMSFDLAQNEVLGLIGPNGSGKTTMLNLISGALRVERRRDPAATATTSRPIPRARSRKRGVARTFQIVRMLPSLTVLENVAAGGVFGHAPALGPRARRPRPRPVASRRPARRAATARSRR